MRYTEGATAAVSARISRTDGFAALTIETICGCYTIALLLLRLVHGALKNADLETARRLKS